MKKMTRFLSLFLTMALILGCVPMELLGKATEEGIPVGEVVMEEAYTSPVIYPTLNAISTFSLDENGYVALKNGNYEKWIDRLDLTDADYARDFYEWLEDNTGTNGVLVDLTKAERLEVQGQTYYAHLLSDLTFTGTWNYDLRVWENSMDEQEVAAWMQNRQSHFMAVMAAFDRDHPEVFWLTGGVQNHIEGSYSYLAEDEVEYQYKFYAVLKTDSFDIRHELYQNTAKLRSKMELRDSRIDEIIAQLGTGSRYDKLQRLNNILTTTNCYNSNLSTIDHNGRECISALTSATGTSAPVCEAYARAFKVVCDEIGVPCVLVSGQSHGEGHMWNYARMEDGNWYAVDVTWNDPTVSGITSLVSGYEHEGYLLVGSNTYVNGDRFDISHTMINDVYAGNVAFTNGPVLSEEEYDLGMSGTGDPCMDGHTYGEPEFVWAEDNSCTAVFTCVFEDKEETVSCEVTEFTTAPTETTEGKTVYTAVAEWDGVSYTDTKTVTIPVIHTHSYTATVTPPTCTEDGYTTYTCTCGDSYIGDEIQATGHSYSKTVIEPTCTAGGYTTYTCTCGDSYTGDETQAMGHSYSKTVKEPTCTAGGYTTYTCTCGDSYIGDETQATGHSYSDDTDATCNACGYVREVEATTAIPFTEAEWEVLKLTNEYREAEGLDPLTGYALLQEAGDIRAHELTQYYNHTRPDGTPCYTVLDELGITYYSAGENIAQGFRSAASVVNAWMNSEGHRRNILTEDFYHLASGNEGYSWVQMFTSGSKYTKVKLLTSGTITADPGTSIDELDLAAVLSSKVSSECYLPVRDSYCTGYDPNKTGDQTVKLSVLGVSTSFTIHVHNWAGKCGEPQICDLCGETRDAAASAHVYGEWTETKAATCTKTGEERRDCQNCDHYETRKTQSLGHTEETIPGKAATCTETGLTDGVKCSDCGTIIVEQETIPAKGHQFEDNVCSLCGYTEPNAMSPEEKAFREEIANSEWGYVLLTEDVVLSQDLYIPEDVLVEIAEGGSLTVPAGVTLDIGGWLTVYDGELDVEEDGILRISSEDWAVLDVWGGKLDVTGADISGVPVNTIRVLLDASEVKGLETDMLYGDCLVGSTEDVLAALTLASEYGFLQLDVADSFALTADITIPENVFWNMYYTSFEVTLPEGVTFTNDGEVVIDSENRMIVEPGASFVNNGFTYVDPNAKLIVRGSYEENGQLVGEVTYEHVHSYTAAVTKPTCTETGYTTYTCACGDSYTDNKVAPLGHTEEIIPGKEATCTEEGLTDGKKCSVCDAVIQEQQAIAKIEHNYVNGFCTACGVEDNTGEKILWGDADRNGRIQTNDAKLILQYCAEMVEETALNLAACDVDGNGRFQTNDAKLILQLCAEMIENFPVAAK